MVPAPIFVTLSGVAKHLLQDGFVLRDGTKMLDITCEKNESEKSEKNVFFRR